MADTLNLSTFFRDFTDSTQSIRLLTCYDSMSDDLGSSERCTVERAIAEAWEPAQQWTSRVGPAAYTPAARMISNTITSAGPGGWANKQGGIANMHRPGGTQANGSSGGTYLVGGLMSGGESGIAPNTVTDWETTTWPNARTAYSADFSTTGVVTYKFGQMNAFTGGGSNPTYGGWAGAADGFSGVQASGRIVWLSTTNGMNDMKIKALRQSGASQNITSTNNTTYVGAFATVDFSDAGARSIVNSQDIDCGTGVGVPGMILANPDASGVAASSGAVKGRMYVAGFRFYLGTPGNPTPGLSSLALAAGSFTAQQHASTMGVADQLAGFSTPADGPNPYCSATITRDYIKAMLEDTDGTYATHIIIYSGHNLAPNESTELASGTSATMISALNAIMDQHNANADALSQPRPKFLIVNCEKFYTSYTATQNANKALTMEYVAGQRGCAFINLFAFTDDGTALDATMWYSVSGYQPTVASSGAGPTTSGIDRVHNSYPGARYIWRMVWEMGLQSLGYVPNVRGNEAFQRAPVTRAASVR